MFHNAILDTSISLTIPNSLPRSHFVFLYFLAAFFQLDFFHGHFKGFTILVPRTVEEEM